MTLSFTEQVWILGAVLSAIGAALIYWRTHRRH